MREKCCLHSRADFQTNNKKDSDESNRAIPYLKNGSDETECASPSETKQKQIATRYGGYSVASSSFLLIHWTNANGTAP